MTEPTPQEIDSACWAWRNDKNRETGGDDDKYFRNHWRSLPGLGAYVTRELCGACHGDGGHPHLWANRCRHCGRIGPVSMEEYRERGGSLPVIMRESSRSEQTAVDETDNHNDRGFI